jgi:hypothetical protein
MPIESGCFRLIRCLPGAEAEAVSLLDAFLRAARELAEAAARQAEPADGQMAERSSGGLARK